MQLNDYINIFTEDPRLARYLFLSIIGHILFFFFTIHAISYQTTLEKKDFIPAYALQQKPLDQKMVLHAKSLLKITRPHPRQLKPMTPSVQIKSTIHQELLNILHQKISEQQIYPDAALALKQTGSVTIGLRLQPNGIVKNVVILKSSGIPSLDDAALRATQAISPLEHIDSYIKNDESFRVDIVFGDLS